VEASFPAELNTFSENMGGIALPEGIMWVSDD